MSARWLPDWPWWAWAGLFLAPWFAFGCAWLLNV
jgi:hypothetical protein